MIAGDHWRLDTEHKIFDGDTEAEFLAKSASDVAKHYGGGLLDQKTVDWCMLIQAVAIVYGSRIMMSRLARKPKPAPTHFEPAKPSPMKKPNGGDNAGTVNIAGLGEVDIPIDSPLHPNYKPPVH